MPLNNSLAKLTKSTLPAVWAEKIFYALKNNLKGKLLLQEPIASYTWFQVGGVADLFFIPHDETELQFFLQAIPKIITTESLPPIYPIGAASNLLVRDGGIRGIVIKLGKGFNTMQYIPKEKEPSIIQAGAAVLLASLSQFALSQEITGLEFYLGIPGTVGGAVAMNAGCFGQETKDIMLNMVGINFKGQKIFLSHSDLQFSYRHSALPTDVIITQVFFHANKGQHTAIKAKMLQLKAEKQNNQPLRGRTGGSSFKNPISPISNRKPNEKTAAHAWQLIDSVGLRGHRIGDASFSEKHCNFLLNNGNATAHELETLGELARDLVQKKHNICLEWEIKIIGEKYK